MNVLSMTRFWPKSFKWMIGESGKSLSDDSDTEIHQNIP